MKPDSGWQARGQRVSSGLLLALLLFGSALLPADQSTTGDALAEAATRHSGDGAGVWIVPPGVPGADIPPAGRSLFDHIFTDSSGPEPVYRIPFPFTALRAELMRRLRTDSQGTLPIQQVLIPLGRSLQRIAAAPDFFRYPRVVLAVDGEPLAGAGESGIFLKDRLYLGYLEKPGVLEVISYNEAAGRFEFQVISDYREGGEPQVRYANRAVCTACHQNITPIFSRPLWGETNANSGIAALLRAEQRDFYGIPPLLGIDTPGRVDDASDRANRIPAVHLLWQQGCGTDPESQSARACRAQVLTFALQLRLSNSLEFSRSDNPEWTQFMRAFDANWRTRWPQGLLLSSPDVANRIPVPEAAPVHVAAVAMPAQAPLSGAERLHQQRHIPAELEPLRPREPLERWQADQAALELITGAAGFFAQIDVERLDEQLFTLGKEVDIPKLRQQSDCRLAVRTMPDRVLRIAFQCADPHTQLHAEGRLYLESGRLIRGTLDALDMGDRRTMRELTLTDGVITQDGERSHIRLGIRRGGLHARLPDGNALSRLNLTWSGAAEPGQSITGSATLERVQDFPLLKRSLAQISTAQDEADREAFAARPLRRSAVMQSLARALDMAEVVYCCLDGSRLPPLHVDQAAHTESVDIPEVGPEAAFFRRCTLCHRTSEPFPPNFLTGTAEEVRGKLAQCAERLFVRLSMWDLSDAVRTKTPMPPLQALPQLGLDQAGWQTHPDLAALQGYAQQLLTTQTGERPKLEALVARGYENLRPCLTRSE